MGTFKCFSALHKTNVTERLKILLLAHKHLPGVKISKWPVSFTAELDEGTGRSMTNKKLKNAQNPQIYEHNLYFKLRIC